MIMLIITLYSEIHRFLNFQSKEAEYLKGTRNIQVAVSKTAKMSWEKALQSFWSNEEEAEEELNQFIGYVKEI
jgi:hypothetical protein